MKITKAHLDYWREKKAPVPAWASDLRVAKSNAADVHGLINAQTEGRYSARKAELDRTLKILSGNQRRGGCEFLTNALASMSFEPGLRGAACKRWALRLAKNSRHLGFLADLMIDHLSTSDIAELIGQGTGIFVESEFGDLTLASHPLSDERVRGLVMEALASLSFAERQRWLQPKVTRPPTTRAVKCQF